VPLMSTADPGSPLNPILLGRPEDLRVWWDGREPGLRRGSDPAGSSAHVVWNIASSVEVIELAGSAAALVNG